ncbi:hypothetical protein niasHT_010677 [Heterodera trifolii]|uniref:Uncharacterized protein n=1 Tax=Heterodera trifolii TaxID=157864 RepID=A0ABD2LEJ0_9BILA
MTYFVQNSTSTFSLFKWCGAQATSSPRQQQQQQRFTRDQFLALARNAACTEYAPRRFHAIVMRLRTGSTTAATTTTTTTPTTTTGTTTALIFQSGRVVLTGIGGGGGGVAVQQIHALCRHEAHRVCRRVVDALTRGGFPALCRSLRVNGLQLRNLVSTLHMPYRLNIEGMAQHLLQRMTIHGKQRPNDNNNKSNNLAGQIVGVARACLDLCTFPGLRCALRIGGQQKGGNMEEADFVVTGLFFISGTVIVTGVRDPLLLKCAVDTIHHLCAQYIRA